MPGTVVKVGPNSQREIFVRLDGRGTIARRMKAIRAALIDALGGGEVISPQQLMIIESIAERRVRADMIFAAMMAHPESVSIENERRYYWHTSAIDRALRTLGLHRRVEGEPRLSEVLKNGGS